MQLQKHSEVDVILIEAFLIFFFSELRQFHTTDISLPMTYSTVIRQKWRTNTEEICILGYNAV
jgi:hypothetical protein